jgi:predicted SAM-dependent methyltransferase
MKLHLGCGYKRIEGFVNIDTRNIPDVVDVVDDITNLSGFEDNSISLIYCSHVLEHIKRLEYMDVLKKWHSLLKVGGVLRVAIPDFEKVVDHYNKNKNIEQIRGFVCGGQDYPENIHYCVWDYNRLKSDLESLGFKDVRRYDWRETEHSHIDDYSQCYLPHMDKENGTLMSLNVEAIKM